MEKNEQLNMQMKDKNDLLRAVTDMEYREKLFGEYEID